MQRKNTLIFKYNQDILGTLFCYAFLAESVQNLQFLLIQGVGPIFNIAAELQSWRISGRQWLLKVN